MELEGKLSKIKMSICPCNIHNSHCLEDSSICTNATEASTCVSDNKDITSESVDITYATILYNDSIMDEIIVAGTTYYKSNKNISTAKHLSKI